MNHDAMLQALNKVLSMVEWLLSIGNIVVAVLSQLRTAG